MTTHEVQVIDRLARIEEKLDGLVDLPKRVTALEKWQSWLKGAYAVAAAVVGWFFWPHKP